MTRRFLHLQQHAASPGAAYQRGFYAGDSGRTDGRRAALMFFPSRCGRGTVKPALARWSDAVNYPRAGHAGGW